MISPVHQAILRCLDDVCELSDDVRFGQLIDFLGFLAQDAGGRPLADIEDEDFLRIVERYRTALRQRANLVEPRA